MKKYWEISKQFNWCYGHRVFNQTTNSEFALNRPPKCRHIHGHRGEVHIFLISEKLENDMVTDFCNLEWLKKFGDTYIDHKLIVCNYDPYFKETVEMYRKIPVLVPETDYKIGEIFCEKSLKLLRQEQKEVLEGMLIVDFIPTSENLAKWMFNIVNYKMKKINVKCSKIIWCETPKSKACYAEY